MARYQFGGNDTITALGPDGKTLQITSAGSTITAWSARTGGTQYTDLQAADGSAISGGNIVATDEQVPVFFGPDGVSQAWLASNGGKRYLTSAAVNTQVLAQVTSTSSDLTAVTNRVATLEQAGPVGTTNGKFLISGNRPGPLATGSLVPGGINIDYSMTFGSVLLHLDQHAEGADARVEVFTQTRATGVQTSQGVATFTAGASRRAVITFTPALSVNAGDRILLVCQQIGTDKPGAGLSFSIRGTDATTATALAAPGRPTGTTAALSGTADVLVSWTPLGSGVVAGYQVYRDDALVATAPGQSAASLLDPGVGDQAHTYGIYAVNEDAVGLPGTASYTPAAAPGGATVPVVRSSAASGSLSAQGTSVVLTVSRSVVVGDRVVVALAASGGLNATAASVWSCADSKGNAYTVDAAPAYQTGAVDQAGIFSARVTTALAANDTITLTTNTAVVRGAARAFSLANIVTTSPVDVSLTGFDPTTDRSLPSASTGTLAQAAEVVVAVWATIPTVTTASGSFQLGSPVASSQGTNDRQVNYETLVTSSTTALSPAMTIPATSPASHSSYAVVSYKGA